ncbi:MAG TPA: hypothetical protein DD435_17480 [Cyanobacteria bacterium UBA8530]|nr:hypothetical protein [Cyanobacteria bacterium UBA8530]
MIYRFSIYGQAEALLLLELAREHKGSLTIKCTETSFFTEIAVYPAYPQLLEYFDFMLERLRSQQRRLENLYQNHPGVAPESDGGSHDPFLLWSKDLPL